MSTCVTEINSWMASNRLKLNPSKTELIWLGSSRRLKHCPQDKQTIAGVRIKPTLLVRNLGVMVDGELTMANHISHLTRTCFYHLRQLRVVRRSLTTDTAHSLIRALVHSRLDYCNGTLAGLPQYQLNKLQSILRASARLVLLLLPGRASVSSLMRARLHWLPFPERIKFKLCSTVYKMSPRCRTSLHFCPSFVSRFPLKRRRPGLFRSGSCCLEQSSNGPQRRNFDFSCVTVFKKLLKTHLFDTI